jgi:hypothetical protein
MLINRDRIARASAGATGWPLSTARLGLLWAPPSSAAFSQARQSSKLGILPYLSPALTS